MVETSSVILDPKDSARVSRRRLTRLWCWLAGLAGVLLLFYGVVGYFGCANMFGDHPRWRGMNRGPADFGLRGETVSFTSQDGIPLKAWWLPPMVGHEEPLSSPTGSITRDKSCCRVQLFSSMPVMTFSLWTSEVMGKAAGPSSRPDSWKRGIFWAQFDTSVLAETTNPWRSWEFLTGQ